MLFRSSRDASVILRTGKPQGPLVPNRKWCFRAALLKKQAPTKTGESYSKPESGCFARRFCHSENRKTAGPPRSQSKVVFSSGASQETGSGQEYYILRESRKWSFRMTLLSFCHVEQTIARQKVAFPSFRAVRAEASVVPPSGTSHCTSESRVSIFRAVQAEASVVLPSGTSHCTSESSVSIFSCSAS